MTRTPPAPRRRRDAFTLAEVLIVVAIVSVLAALVLPALGGALQYADALWCRNNLRQMGLVMRSYLAAHEGLFPPAYRAGFSGGVFRSEAWDFTTVRDWSQGGATTVAPGLLWMGTLNEPSEVHQCPSFEGAHNWLADPYTGYNYNADYLGSPRRETHISEVKAPDRCAMFGDAGFASGANKFMRAPFAPPPDLDDGLSPGGRTAGTQAFRHMGKTHVVFVDGHVAALEEPYTETLPSAGAIAPGTGFLAPDNRLYSLDGSPGRGAPTTGAAH